MIVLDEQLDDPEIRKAIKRWSQGKVINITEARRLTSILDDAMPTLLHGLKDPTFVTTNYKDFWKKIEPHEGYAIICIKLPIERVLEVPDILRELLKLPELATKRQRMGKVVSYSDGQIKFYE